MRASEPDEKAGPESRAISDTSSQVSAGGSLTDLKRARSSSLGCFDVGCTSINGGVAIVPAHRRSFCMA
jgi:hypothetical protein